MGPNLQASKGTAKAGIQDGGSGEFRPREPGCRARNTFAALSSAAPV
jgi:hypothetical protein